MDLSLASRTVPEGLQRQWAGARPILQATYASLPACEEPVRACTLLPACEAPTSVRAAVNGWAVSFPSMPAVPRKEATVLCRQVARRPVPIFFFGHQNRGPPATYATPRACEVPTSRGAATNRLKGFPPSIRARSISRGEARYPGREAGQVLLFSGHAQAQGVFFLFPSQRVWRARRQPQGLLRIGKRIRP